MILHLFLIVYIDLIIMLINHMKKKNKKKDLH